MNPFIICIILLALCITLGYVCFMLHSERNEYKEMHKCAQKANKELFNKWAEAAQEIDSLKKQQSIVPVEPNH